MQVYEALASLDFGAILSQASYQTQTGKNLVEKYQSYVMTNAVTCGLVNSFLNEAKNCLYDSGVQKIYETVAQHVSENKYSWMLASACERIENNNSSYNYLNRNAAGQVRKLLEMKENEVVSYVKAGALKNVMYCEDFRRIAKAIYKDQPIVESFEKYQKTHPISIVEQKDGAVYFVAANGIYKINEGNIAEAPASEVSNEFLTIARLIESNALKYENSTLTYENNNMKIEISESGIVKEKDGKKTEMTVEQFRDHNSLYVNSIIPAQRNQMGALLEGLAKIAENFSNICILDNVSIVSSKNDTFLTIECGDQMFAKSLASNHTSNWQVNENIYEAVNFIKSRINVDLTEEYQDKINGIIEKVEGEETQKIQEEVKQNELLARKKTIEELIEKHKDDPVRMAVLSKAAEKLGKLL